jgi:hypothetical protein
MSNNFSEYEVRVKGVLIISSIQSRDEEQAVGNWIENYGIVYGKNETYFSLLNFLSDKLGRLENKSNNSRSPSNLTDMLSRRIKLRKKIDEWKKTKKTLIRK